MTILRKGFIYVLLLIGAAAITGYIYQWRQSVADRDRFPAPGKLINVGDVQLHIDCRGTGTPVVILEAGLTSGSASWALVHDAIAEHTRVCAYDRPGMDWSEPINRTANAEEIAERLHQLLNASEMSGPYVLLGMSAGGVYVREYYRKYPQNIVGMVLVDSSHEQQDTRLPRFDGEDAMERSLSLCRWAQPLGIIRFLEAMNVLVDQYEIPEPFRALKLANANQSHTCASMLAEVHSFANEVVDSSPPTSLGDLPLTVLSQGNEPKGNEAFGISDEMAREQRIVWDQLQEELTSLSSHGRRQIAKESGHVIQLEQPQLVIDAVAAMVAKVPNNPRVP